MFLIIVDAHSKWPEVEIMPSTTSTQTIDRLRTIFARYGVPAQVVTPHSTTGESPSMLFLGRPLRTRLDLVKPDLQMKVMNRQIDQAGRKGHTPHVSYPLVRLSWHVTTVGKTSGYQA